MRPKIVLTRGIPGAGKSTWSKSWVQEDVEHRVRVNRDSLRKMLYGTDETILTWAQEQNVSAVEMAIAKTALEKGKDVVVDAMHLKAAYIKRWFALGYDVEFKDFWIDLDEALARNAERAAASRAIGGDWFDRWLAAHDDEVRAAALAEQGETEWEYGNEQLMHSRVEVFPASSEAVAKAQAWLYPMRRRRKAGPWMPVEHGIEADATDRENGSND